MVYRHFEHRGAIFWKSGFTICISTHFLQQAVKREAVKRNYAPVSLFQRAINPMRFAFVFMELSPISRFSIGKIAIFPQIRRQIVSGSSRDHRTHQCVSRYSPLHVWQLVAEKMLICKTWNRFFRISHHSARNADTPCAQVLIGAPWTFFSLSTRLLAI